MARLSKKPTEKNPFLQFYHILAGLNKHNSM